MRIYDHNKGIDLRKPADIEAARLFDENFSKYELVTLESLHERKMREQIYTRNYGVRYYYNNPRYVSPEVAQDMVRNFDHYMIGEDTMGVYKVKTLDSVNVAILKNGIQYNRQVQKLKIQEEAHNFPWKPKRNLEYNGVNVGNAITVRDPRDGSEVLLMGHEYKTQVRWDPDIKCYIQIIFNEFNGIVYSSTIIPEEQYETYGHLPGTSNKLNTYDIVSDPGFSGAYI